MPVGFLSGEVSREEFLLPRPRVMGRAMDQDETGCEAPESPILCVNNCGFFGSAATMNMCSKCHRDVAMEEQAKLAASSIETIVNRGGGIKEKKPIISGNADLEIHPPAALDASPSTVAPAASRCGTCRKRVGLTGFHCRCGSVFCALHRYSDKHDCTFNYREAARDAIGKANPVVKAEKLDKI